jgi:hypothetical protein
MAVIPVNAGWVGFTDNFEADPYVGALWSSFAPSAGDAISHTPHAGLHSWKVENSTIWSKILPVNTTYYIASTYMKMSNVYDWVCLTGGDNAIILSAYNATHALFRVQDDDGLTNLTFPYNIALSPWIKIQLSVSPTHVIGTVGTYPPIVRNDPDTTFSDVYLDTVSLFTTIYIDDVNLQYRGDPTSSSVVNNMIPLIGIMGILGLSFPMLAMKGQSSMAKIIALMVYLLVVGSLMNVAFNWI